MTQERTVRDGVRIGYEVTGEGDPAIVLLPPWMVVDSRSWDAQVGPLAATARVVRYDSRGTGRSDRPRDPAAYAMPELVADALAVLDAAGVRRAVLAGNSLGGALAYLLAARCPERVAGIVLIAPTINVDGDESAPIVTAGRGFETDHGGPDEGWARYNRHALRRDPRGFVEWFVGLAAPGPELAAQRARAAATAPDAEILAATLADRVAVPPREQAALFRALAPAVTCPALVVHGDRDAVVPPAWGRSVADLLGARHVTVPGAGHCPHLSHPDVVNSLLAGFAAGVLGRSLT
jgi:pimeloyl-ACP methyl ester carboxylesterase